MAFTNTTISTPNPKAEEKKLKERLSFLGKKMDEAEVNAASYKNIISKKEQAEKELAGLEIELQSVKDNLHDLEKEQKEALRNNELFGADIMNTQKERDAEMKKGQDMKEKLDTELSALRSEKVQVEKCVAELERGIASNQQALYELVAQNEKLTKDNETLKLSLTSTQNTLLSATEEFETLLHSVEQKQKEFSELNVVTDVKQKQVVSLGNQVVSFEEKLTALKTAINEEEEKVKHILEAEKLKITEREGNLTLRESWLKEKEESLRKFHGELEKFFGKKININV